jgi:hypothetical protein
MQNMVTTINSFLNQNIYSGFRCTSTALCRLVQHKLDYVVVYTLVPSCQLR